MKKTKAEQGRRGEKSTQLIGVDCLPQGKYEGIDMIPIWQFIEQYLLGSLDTPQKKQAALDAWLAQAGFLESLSKFSFTLPENAPLNRIKRKALDLLAIKFMAVFTTSILPDFFYDHSQPEYALARRNFSQLKSYANMMTEKRIKVKFFK